VSPRPQGISVLSETAEGKMFEERVEKHQFLTLRFCCGRRKNSSLKNLAGALRTDGVKCTSSVGREVKMEILAQVNLK